MKKLGWISLVVTLCAGAFVAGLAIGAPKKAPVFHAFEEITLTELMPAGPKLGSVIGDHKKGSYTGLFWMPAGFTSPMHTHNGAYDAIQIKGTSTHWVEGEDGTQAKKMTPGSHWMMPARLAHVSACAAGEDCLMVLIQKGKFDFKPYEPKPAKGAAPAPAKGAAAPAPAPAPAAKAAAPAPKAAAPAPAPKAAPAPAPAKKTP
jgi:quercetin dioxygenase-like cupin family protein